MEMEIAVTQLAPGDPRLVDAIVGQLKSKGIFDKFRKECLADVDTKPAYQNLRTRVDTQVKKFLGSTTWRSDLNKNHLRESVRKYIQESGILDSGIDAIISQVVNPKITPLFLPYVEETVYAFLKIERPNRGQKEHTDPIAKETGIFNNQKPVLEVVDRPSQVVGANVEERDAKENKSGDAKLPVSLLHMDTDVISSEEDDILARGSPEENCSQSPVHQSEVKVEEDNAVDGFEEARQKDQESLTYGVQCLNIKDSATRSVPESMDVDKDSSKPSLPLFDAQSLDTISSNSSGLSFSPLSDNKSPKGVVAENEPNFDLSQVSTDNIRSSQSTPLVDEHSPDRDSLSPSDTFREWGLGSKETSTTFTSASEKKTEVGLLPTGTSPVSADSSSVGSLSADESRSQESKGSTARHSTEDSTTKKERSEGELSSSSPSPEAKAGSDDGRRPVKSHEHSEERKKFHSRSSSRDHSKERDHKSSRDREPESSGKDKERSKHSSRSHHDDHHSHKEKYKRHHRRDKDDDGDRHSHGHGRDKSSSDHRGSKDKGREHDDRSDRKSGHSSHSHKSHSGSHKSHESSGRSDKGKKGSKEVRLESGHEKDRPRVEGKSSGRDGHHSHSSKERRSSTHDHSRKHGQEKSSNDRKRHVDRRPSSGSEKATATLEVNKDTGRVTLPKEENKVQTIPTLTVDESVSKQVEKKGDIHVIPKNEGVEKGGDGKPPGKDASETRDAQTGPGKGSQATSLKKGGRKISSTSLQTQSKQLGSKVKSQFTEANDSRKPQRKTKGTDVSPKLVVPSVKLCIKLSKVATEERSATSFIVKEENSETSRVTLRDHGGLILLGFSDDESENIPLARQFDPEDCSYLFNDPECVDFTFEGFSPRACKPNKETGKAVTQDKKYPIKPPLKKIKDMFIDSDSETEFDFEGFEDNSIPKAMLSVQTVRSANTVPTFLPVSSDSTVVSYTEELLAHSPVSLSSTGTDSSVTSRSPIVSSGRVEQIKIPIDLTLLSRPQMEVRKRGRPRKKRNISESSSASSAYDLPSVKRSKADEITELEEERVVLTHFQMLTPEDDRVSGKEDDVDYAERGESYSPLSPASESSADEVKLKKFSHLQRCTTTRSRKSNSVEVKAT